MDELHTTKPDIVVGVTSRCWTPRLNEGNWKLLLDFVDTMSVNYNIRSKVSSPTRYPLFRYLAGAHNKAEENSRWDFPEAIFFHAGYAEAKRQGSVWIPNLVSDVGTPPQLAYADEPTNDLVFFGALYTPINVDAIRALDKAYAASLKGRTVMLAGRNPTKEVLDLVKKNQWKLVVNFPNVDWLRNQAKVAVAPLGPSTGIQNKVLDAAVSGIPQTLTESILKGFKPGFPLKASPDQASAIAAAADLAQSDVSDRFATAQATRQYVLHNYGTRRWATVLAEILAIDYQDPIQSFESLLSLEEVKMR